MYINVILYYHSSFLSISCIQQRLGQFFPYSLTSINPHLTNGFSHHYHLGESTFILGASAVVFF